MPKLGKGDDVRSETKVYTYHGGLRLAQELIG